MYDHIREDTLYIMLYAAVTVIAMLASGYLLFRRGNVFSTDITPPARLRRWAAAFFAILALNHLWYMPIFFLSSSEDIKMIDLLGGLLDCMTLFPVAIILLFIMLQDRRRPLWPVAAMMAPIVVIAIYNVTTRSYTLLTMIYVYALLMCMGLIIYMVRALRQYGRWLRDNFADLEHKEVWQSFVVLAIVLLVFAIYAFSSEGPVYQYAMQVIVLVLISYLLWRVETLSDLSISVNDVKDLNTPDKQERGISPGEKYSLSQNIGPLLKQYCEEPQLYLQHDLTLLQLAKAVGTNRLYLSQYFSAQGITYNAYINDLRINHFVSLYREAVAANRSFTAQQLAHESGYHSYSTFRHAFKLRMGQNVREWMSDTAQKCQN